MSLSDEQFAALRRQLAELSPAQRAQVWEAVQPVTGDDYLALQARLLRSRLLLVRRLLTGGAAQAEISGLTTETGLRDLLRGHLPGRVGIVRGLVDTGGLADDDAIPYSESGRIAGRL
jgi:hypothetical protein